MGYTLAYKRTYEEWINEKSKRIYDYLKYVYEKGLPIDFQDLAFKVYFERLFDYRKALWKPYQGRFLDLKPSPFIRNFLYFLCDQLKIRGYLFTNYVVEIRESAFISDFKKEEYGIEKEEVRIYFENRLIGLPTLEEIKDICVFHPDPF
jgi:hypothetical protein